MLQGFPRIGSPWWRVVDLLSGRHGAAENTSTTPGTSSQEDPHSLGARMSLRPTPGKKRSSAGGRGGWPWSPCAGRGSTTLSGPGSQSHRITAVIVMLVIFLVMLVIFAVMLVIGSMNCGIVPV